jgi:hypothetical protein
LHKNFLSIIQFFDLPSPSWLDVLYGWSQMNCGSYLPKTITVELADDLLLPTYFCARLLI